MLSDFSWLQLSVLFIAILITGISKSGFAGGFGVITVPLLSLVMSPVVAVSVMLPTLILMDMLSVRLWWGKQHNGILKVLIPSGVAGIVVGYFTFHLVDDDQIRGILGGIAVLFGLYGLASMSMARLAQHLKFHGHRSGILLGVVSGFTSFVAHAGGPPLNMYLLGMGLNKTRFLSTAVMFFTAINLAKLPPYLALGQLNRENLLIAFVFLPISWVGVKAGVWLQNQIQEAVFFRLIYLLLIGLGVYLLYQSL